MAGYPLSGPFEQPPSWEKKENPQAYDQSPFYYVSAKPGRNMLGIVGGNDASLIVGNQVDLESDLRRINIPNTFCPSRRGAQSHASAGQNSIYLLYLLPHTSPTSYLYSLLLARTDGRWDERGIMYVIDRGQI